MNHEVFVSYSSEDKNVADAIVSRLEKKGIRCWYAPRDIPPGEEWAGSISDAIAASEVMLLVFSKNANRSQHVLDELNLAISEQIKILPFRIENLDPSGAMRLHLSSRHWLDAFSPTWKPHLDRLVDSVAGMVEVPPTLDGEPLGASDDVETKVESVDGSPKIGSRKWLIGLVAAVVLTALAAGFFIWGPFDRTRIAQSSLQGGAGEVGTPTEVIFITPSATIVPSRTPPPIPTRFVDDRQVIYLGRDGEWGPGLDEINDMDVFIQNVDGSNQVQLTSSGGTKGSLAVSPNGNYIAYVGRLEGDFEIFVVNADGEGRRQLTSNDWDDSQPSFSPDGDEIIFISAGQIHTMDFDGSHQQQVVQLPGEARHPVYSPDGEMIVFASNHDGADFELYAMDRDGQNLQQLTDNEWDDLGPAFSPDGSELLYYARIRDLTNEILYEIIVMDLEDYKTRQVVTDLTLVEPEPAFSPDGEEIAFVKWVAERGIGAYGELMLIGVDGSGLRDIFPYTMTVYDPAFMPTN